MVRYALAIFTSAFLLFGVQPLAGRYALPWYGGTPAVWTACMLFFQAVLLAGYAYAHAVASRLRPRAQAALHLSLLVVALAALAARASWTGSPLAPGDGWRPVDDHLPVLRLMRMLAATLGLPFFVLSTTGPLIQSWFARARPERSPYVLYALSNAGSLLALLGYPFLVEPWVGRSAQAWGWAAGFVLFVLCVLACARDLLRRAPATNAPETSASPGVEARSEASVEASAASASQRPGVGPTLTWLALSTCASVLLLATTNKLSQDVAAGPFLWVMPLAVYLVTFILAFSRESFYARTPYSVGLIASVVLVTYAHKEGPALGLGWQVLFHASALFTGAMVCHGELYRRRPAPRYLSAFYLWVSVGGVVGGVFVNLVAPAIFTTYWEHPLALAACCAVAFAGLMRKPKEETAVARTQRLFRGALLVGVAVHLPVLVLTDLGRVRFAARNFFGVVRVLELSQNDPQQHQYVLRHGAITHGWQYIRPERRNLPTAYYTTDAGLGLALAAQRQWRQAQGLPTGLRVGMLGLGVGNSATLMAAGDDVRFYEINPDIIDLAKGQGGFFSTLTDTPAHVEVVEGDARISLEKELEQGSRQFDVLALDVFSSDAIPVHLLTKEAVALYLQHLAPHGVLAMHISNQHLDLVPISLAHARAAGLAAALVARDSDGDAVSSSWMLLSRDPEFFWGSTFSKSRARVRRLVLRGEPEYVWTDERSSVLQALRPRAQGPAGANPNVMDVPARALVQPAQPVVQPASP
ncbi:ferrichrome ABC transporter permease [Corallococcus coralloides DSM 2259]|uniref:Ferrichrome ABC transporter permease n=1 Tax=Corallococcus coralloides (strain ATCC 25202 / DSM 2259 / NBRC 100086 / M2) TaxID=1144275 RepID=H8MIF4_CORCM|nr:ferrichrome ABC transporter permease [Corallococcus coralloides]AFE07348.1 ferrichrome ABC transporter permease [Corallococcus coralloides DSM 2259]